MLTRVRKKDKATKHMAAGGWTFVFFYGTNQYGYIEKHLGWAEGADRKGTVLDDGDRVLTDGRDKAEVLIKRYAAVSRPEPRDPALAKQSKKKIRKKLIATENPIVDM